MSGPDRTTSERIRRRAERMQRSRSRSAYNPLRGLSAFGVVGWSVALPTVLGALLGLWLDRVAPQAFSWPLALILAGVVLGVIVAWEWVAQEEEGTREDARPPAEREAGDD
jgi:ATP synthase protein I